MYKSKQTPSDLMAFFSIFQELSHSKVVTGTREDLYPFLSGGSPKNRQITQKNQNHLSKQQAVATQIPTQLKQKLTTIFI